MLFYKALCCTSDRIVKPINLVYLMYMIYTSKIQQVILLAIETHEINKKQKRKGKDIPYITHPLTVGLILSRAGASEDVVISGILHDTIEDSDDEHKITKEIISEKFGENVSNLVLSITEENKELPWEERKAIALEHINDFSNDSVLLKSADLISNVSEIKDDYDTIGNDVFNRFNAKKDKTLWNYTKVAEKLLNQWPENPLSEDLKNILEKTEKRKSFDYYFW